MNKTFFQGLLSIYALFFIIASLSCSMGTGTLSDTALDDRTEIIAEILDQTDTVLPPEEQQILSQAVRSLSEYELSELEDHVNDFMSSVEVFLLEHPEFRTIDAGYSSVSDRSLLLQVGLITSARNQLLDAFNGISMDDIKREFIRAGLGYSRELLGGIEGSLSIGAAVGGYVSLESGAGVGTAWDFRNFNRYDYTVNFFAGSGGLSIGVEADGPFPSIGAGVITTENLLFNMDRYADYAIQKNVFYGSSIGVEGSVIAGLGLSTTVAFVHAVDDAVWIPALYPQLPVGPPTGEKAFSIVTKVKAEAGDEVGVSVNAGVTGGAIINTPRVSSVRHYLTTSSASRGELISAGFEMAKEILFSGGGTPGLSWFAAGLVLLYGCYTDVDDDYDSTSITAIAGGNQGSLGLTILRRDGTVWQLDGGIDFSQTYYSPIQVPLSGAEFVMDNVKSIDQRTGARYMVTENNELWTYNGTDTSFVMNDVRMVANSNYHTMVIRTDNSLWGWGRNYEGQLGNGSNVNIDTPTYLYSDVRSVTLGDDCTAIITLDGDLLTTGKNLYGNLGDGSTENRNSFYLVDNNVIEAEYGGFHLIYAKSDGSVWGTGWNDAGSLALEPYIVYSPALISTQSRGSAVAGYGHTLWLLEGSMLYGSGRNHYGQLGLGQALSSTVVPLIIANDVDTMCAGDWSSAYVTDSGHKVWYMGY